MKDERIKVVKQWLEPKLVRDIQVFLGFTNFYQQFIQNFCCIAISLISMLKTIKNTGFAANFKETEGKIDSGSVIGNSVVGGNEVTNQISFTKSKN